MIVILSVLLGVLAYIGNKYIRKYFSILLVLSIVIGVLSLAIESDITQIVTQGFIGLAFFVVVMFGGAFKRNSKASKRLRSVRKEYSIIGFILLIPHALLYVLQFIDGSYPVEWFGILAMLVMIPLFIISFSMIKKKIPIKKWASIQKWAYLGYALIFIHLIVVSEGANQISYAIVFGVYTLFKLKNYVFSSNKSKVQIAPNILKFSIIAVLLIGGVSMLDITSSSVQGIDFEETSLVDGVYIGSATGFKNLNTELEVTVENGKITEIIMIECGCTAPHHGTDYEEAALDMIEEILSTQSTSLDSISGATKTTKSILEAVEETISDSQTSLNNE